MSNDPQELARDFWEKKCFHHIQMFEYGKYNKEEFILNMKRMGWDKKTTLNLMSEDGL